MNALADARREAAEARGAFQDSLVQLRRRTAPHELVEDALHLVDPELTLLAQIKSRVMENRLVSMALIAGMAWLMSPKAAQGGAARPTTKKEKTHDSGQQRQYDGRRRTEQRDEVAQAWPGKPLTEREEEPAPQERWTRGFGQARPQRSGGGRPSGSGKRGKTRPPRSP